ncbi:hypothetical protein [Natrinema sp. CBA1119]|uniref:hypothetical protein n=1 Tax=Natrinema sp. CBA1119 TaxID=1608465 RepID=UPI0011458AEA|nr:hypothetical protein [Natrinema sp. CBA1119]
MSIGNDELEIHIEELEERAEDIEHHLTIFFDGVKNYPAGKNTLGHQLFSWQTPQGDTKKAQREAREKYEIWHTAARPLVDDYLPQRLNDFDSKYDGFKEIISLRVDAKIGSKDVFDKAIDLFDQQRNLVKALPAKVKSEKFRAREQISSRLTRDEIQQARQLFNNDFIRASGVVAAVALERHLLTMCENSNEVDNYDPTHGISRLAQTLKDAGVIDKTIWNDLRALASIRETCAHAEEPEKEAVRRLINDTEDFIRSLNN